MTKSNLSRALIVALVVGTILNLVNYGPKFIENPGDFELILRVAVTFLIPFLVSLYSSSQTGKSYDKKLQDHQNTSRLASFPEQNPNPVIEVTTSGEITYCNPATDNYFPDIKDLKLNHPILEPIRKMIAENGFDNLNSYWGELVYQDLTFELKLYHLKGSDIIRIYYSDITVQKQTEKKLGHMALFPKQNPNPVVEASYENHSIQYLNPAAERIFPTIKDQQLSHPFFEEIKTRLGEKKDFQCYVEIDGHTFEQKIYFIPNTTIIRIFGNDITDRIETERNLARLASFPEGNPSPIVEFDLKGNITYINPAGRKLFKGIEELKSSHHMMEPFMRYFEELRSGSMNFYQEEVKDGDMHYSQRGSLIEEGNVIRVFSINITEQKLKEELIAEKNRNITDSINYAQKIQRALLPDTQVMLSTLPDSFVFYEPKDIVSGDFYWFTLIEDLFIYVCADCTGHGVPGALMSMIGSNIINHVVRYSNVNSPETALSHLDYRIRGVLKQDDSKDESRSKDGMDLTMCAINLKTGRLQYAGANNPLVLIRNNELIEFKANRMPIGGQFEGYKTYEGHDIQLEEGDCLYVFTDGYIDQFGGPKGKKLLKKRFYELLTDVHETPMTDQKQKLHDYLLDWRNKEEQVDDVLVMGLRYQPR